MCLADCIWFALNLLLYTGRKTTFFSGSDRYTGNRDPIVYGGGSLKIYVDVVAFLNFLVDYLLILATNRLSGFPPDYGRSAAAAMLGGIYGGACLLPGFYFLSGMLWRIVMLTLIAVIAFGWNQSAFRRGGVFILLSMALGGIATGMGQEHIGMIFVSVVFMWVLCNIGFRGSMGGREYIPVRLCWEDKELNIIALKDTGNTLCDPLTGEQVLVAGADIAEKLLNLTAHQLLHPVETLAAAGLPGLRLIPYRAVGQPGAMLLAVRFRDAMIGKRKAQPLVAFAPERIAGGEMYQMLAGGML